MTIADLLTPAPPPALLDERVEDLLWWYEALQT